MKKSKRLICGSWCSFHGCLGWMWRNASNSTEGDKIRAECSAESTKDELVFVNYRDIRDLNPHL